jgi:hypothetical protein
MGGGGERGGSHRFADIPPSLHLPSHFHHLTRPTQAYALVNLSQLLLELSQAPNYRPTFKWATWWYGSSSFDSILCAR